MKGTFVITLPPHAAGMGWLLYDPLWSSSGLKTCSKRARAEHCRNHLRDICKHYVRGLSGMAISGRHRAMASGLEISAALIRLLSAVMRRVVAQTGVVGGGRLTDWISLSVLASWV